LIAEDLSANDRLRGGAPPTHSVLGECFSSEDYYGYATEYCTYYQEYYYDAYYYDYDYNDYYEYLPDSVSQFDERYVGNVAGSKPEYGQCIPVKDTPKINVKLYNQDANLAFANFMNLDDRSFKEGSSAPDLYARSNASKAQSFFIEGVLGCPDIIDYKKDSQGHIIAFWDYANNRAKDLRETITARAEMMRAKADFCYSYYILGHSVAPWFTMERPGAGTDDPLSIFDPDRTYLNSCQPFVRGQLQLDVINDQVKGARDLQMAAWDSRHSVNKYTSLWEKQSGYAPVFQWRGRADWDEADYFLSLQLKKTWDYIFNHVGDGVTESPILKIKDGVNYTNPYNTAQPVELPCIYPNGVPPQTYGSFPPPELDPHTSPPPPGICNAHGDSVTPCSKPWFYMPGDINPGIHSGQTHYCPNVEKIIEPGHPFAPRNDIWPGYYNEDRKYSRKTSQIVQYPDTCHNDCRLGYTNYNADYDQSSCSSQVPKPFPDMDKWRKAMPVVQCGVVPVDILSFREATFDNCIMQRINWNFNAWMAAGYPMPGSWNPPCKTRYWETDVSSVAGGCPVRMSIQQCCRIITKDVVPANFLKIRTCEGLLEKRRQDNGDGSINDYSLQKMLHGTPTGVTPAILRTHVTSDMESNEPLLGLRSYYIGPILGITSPSTGIDATAKVASARLNEFTCDNIEPDEYRFDNYFKKFTNTELFAPPTGFNCRRPDAPPSCFNGKYLGVHLPYMRWWDTGVSAGNALHGGSPVNTLGSFDTIIGVGREARDNTEAELTEKKYKDLMDPYTPQGFFSEVRNRVKVPQLSQVGRFGGWSELKAHEMWTLRRNNLFCVGRYEKMFKQGGPENFVLAKAGAGYSSRVGEQWPWPMGWRGYVTDTTGMPFYAGPPPANRIGLDNVLPGDIIIYTPKAIHTSDPNYHPVSGGSSKKIFYVTDIGGYAQGDHSDAIIPEGSETYFDYTIGRYKKGHYGTCSSNSCILHPTRIFVVAWDQGKFPTSTGMSIHWGQGPERTIYKSAVPNNYANDICSRDMRALTDFVPIDTLPQNMQTYCRKNIAKKELTSGTCMSYQCQPICDDLDYSACVLPNGYLDWKDVVIYRPTDFINRCPDAGVAMPAPFDLNSTYNWRSSWTTTPNGDVKLNLPDPKVIYQSKTQDVPTNYWSWCVNSGYDAPHHYAADYKGAQTGAITDTTICGPTWWDQDITNSGCSARPNTPHYFFPTGQYRP